MKESSRITWLRVVVGLFGLLTLFLGIGSLLFPKAMFDASPPAGQAYNSYAQYATMTIGLLAFTWAVAAAIAFRAPLKHPGLLQAIGATMALLGGVGFYLDVFVSDPANATAGVSDAIVFLMFIALLLLYPRRQKAG